MRISFMKELIIELNKVRLSKIEIDEIFNLIKVILRYFNDEDEEEHETNQVIIGMAKLFRRHIVKVQKDINFRLDKYKTLNLVVVKIHVQYYQKYWMNRNKAYHNMEVQQKKLNNIMKRLKTKQKDVNTHK